MTDRTYTRRAIRPLRFREDRAELGEIFAPIFAILDAGLPRAPESTADQSNAGDISPTDTWANERNVK